MLKIKPAISMNTVIYDGDSKIICMLPIGNGGYAMDIQTGELVRKFETKGNNLSEHLYSMSIKYGEDMFFIPREAKKILKYNREMNAYEEISIEGGKKDEVYDAFVYGDELFLIGRQTYNVYCYSELCRYFKCIKELCCEKNKLMYKRRFTKVSRRVYWEQGSGMLHSYDIEKNEWSNLNVPFECVQEVLYTGDEYYAVSSENELYVSDTIGNQWDRINMNAYGVISSINDFGPHIFVNFQEADKHLVIDKNTHNILKVKNDYYEAGYKYSFVEIDYDTLMIRVYKIADGGYVGESDYYLIYNVVSGQIRKVDISYKGEQERINYILAYIEKVLSNIHNYSGEVFENDDINLEGLLYWMNKNDNYYVSTNIDGSGKKIQQIISKLIK